MNTISTRTWRISLSVAAFLVPVALVTGCGGGGGGGVSNPTPTPTATSVPLALVGTYNGTWTFPGSTPSLSDSGPFVLRINANGSASGVFNENNPDRIVTTSGTVNTSTGAISLSGTFNTGIGDSTGYTATVTVTGTASSSSASGPLRLTYTNGQPPENGSFTSNKTSNDPTPPTPTPTPNPSALKKQSSSVVSSGKRIGHK